MASKPGRDLLTVELDPETRASLATLCELEARESGGNPARLAAQVVRRAIRAEARKKSRKKSETVS